MKSHDVATGAAWRPGGLPALLIVLLILTCHTAFAQPHYERYRSQDVDPFGTNILGLPESVRIAPEYSLAGAANTGRLHIVMSASELAEIEAAGDRQHLRHRLVLTESAAAYWSDHFRKRASPERVPTTVTLLGVIAWPIGLAATVLDNLFSGGDANAATAAQLASVVVPGGQFVTYATVLRSEAGEPYMLSETFYYVTVGSEPSWYAIRAMMHAVRVR